ncbi:MAG TPA: nitrogenase iron-molybdenum cofactor biosynthesis protein NifE, partial [Dissulfurispiraceae bacterium]|nr:nitrogenase iron-molybdenum cofactor biosynthesis protein NifE [Dissulfurispiraceae bacterium]
MITNVDKLMQSGCETEKSEKLCRARGGESCAFDGALIVLQPIADAAHIVHGPISCCGNSWEGRGTLSSKGNLHKWGFTTDMQELDIVYGSEDKLYRAILRTYETAHPKAIFVHATCVSGLIGEDIDAVCKKAGNETGIRVIPVNAPGFVGPKNLGNRIAGEVLLGHVIGTGEPSTTIDCDVNLIGEYNIAGDLWNVEPVLNRAGIRILSRITGDSTFEEITYAHRAKLNVVVCSRALINVAKEMERKYGIPFVEVSFFGKTEMSGALRAIAQKLSGLAPDANSGLIGKVEVVIGSEEEKLNDRLAEYAHLSGKKAVLYTGGVKSWSFISALLDLGIEIVAVGTKKSTFEDEEKMKAILGPDAPLVEDVTPKNLLRLLKEHKADMLVAGGRNKYLAVKEGYPFIDVNQERHRPYAGYEGLVNIAEDLSRGIQFYGRATGTRSDTVFACCRSEMKNDRADLLVNPLKHSQVIGAAIAFQGIHNSVPVVHGAQGCNFLGKVLITNHFREPIAMVSSKLFVENVVMGSEENLIRTVGELVEKNAPDIVGILTTGLSEVKGDDIPGAVKMTNCTTEIVHVSTPDYTGGLETGYAKAVESLIANIAGRSISGRTTRKSGQVNILAGSHLTPADFTELSEIVESFGLRPIMLPDLSALDGSRKRISALAVGGTSVEDIRDIVNSEFTIAIGASMEVPALKLNEMSGIEYRVFESVAGLKDTDMLMETLSLLSGMQMPAKYDRQRRILIDGMRDGHFYCGGRKACLALEPDHAVQLSRLLDDMGIVTSRAVVPQFAKHAGHIIAEEVIVGGLDSIGKDFDILISNSHAEEAAGQLDVPLYQAGF